ncbi:MAG: acetyl-CoA carboxylase biotin carboxyl carrier protein [Planctomycetaceae bacterium]
MEGWMDVKDLKKIVTLMNENGLVEIEIEEEGKRLRLRKAEAPGAVAAAAGPAPAPGEGAAAAAAAPAADPSLHTITAPMVGTFYRSPSPEAESYAEVGRTVTTDSVVCILEAMKVMNEIKADCSGEIVKVCAQNGEAVEFGQALFLVRRA